MESTDSRGEIERAVDALRLRFLLEAPRSVEENGRDNELAVATCPIEPWPHQLQVVRRCVRQFPRGFLFCDEVGLGKTIEAGLALRHLIVSGRVRRALILCPKNLLRQWQEELWEKLALDVPRLEGGVVRDRKDRIRKDLRDVSPWDACPILIASTQTARQEGRREELTQARPWDLIVVDEAHQARRKDRRPGGRPNRLLELLAGSSGRFGLRARTRCLYLLTATPMQLHPTELWDLLRLVGLGGRWGASEEEFLAYFSELRKAPEQRDWPLLLGLLDESGRLGDPPPAVVDAFERGFGDRAQEVLKTLTTLSASDVLSLHHDLRHGLEILLRHFTPLGDHLFRHTRAQLRRYQVLGLLTESIPDRRPENVWIALTSNEQALYDRIDEYLANLYFREGQEKKGLGFLLTVYRRRLTSSFYAVRRSLERRLEGLREDLEAQEVSASDASVPPPREEEIGFLRAFVSELVELGPGTKVRRLSSDLDRLLGSSTSETALVFTQYIDTLDQLREDLAPTWRDRVACYSGRGGEVLVGDAWKKISKEEIKERFRRGEIRVLLCTDAAGEGLNLQTCGLLINFDLPWNPMRVEQRIGRIDRIGQVHAEVRVLNYFYSDTVEAEIYRRLSDRISWFEGVVGALQPILAQVGEAIESLSLTPPQQRREALEARLAGMKERLDEESPLASAWEAPTWGEEKDLHVVDRVDPVQAPLTLIDLERILTRSPVVGDAFVPDEEIDGVYRFRRGDDQALITFSPQIFDRRSSTVELMTWGNPRLDRLLQDGAAEADVEVPRGLALYRADRPAPVGLFLWPVSDGVRRIRTPAELEEALGDVPAPWNEARERLAATLFSEQRRRALDAWQRIEVHRRQGELLALKHAARRILVRSALIELARHRTLGLFDRGLQLEFGSEAVPLLAASGEPFRGLYALVEKETLPALSEDPYFLEIDGRTQRSLDRRAAPLLQEGREVVHRAEQLRRELEEVRRSARSPSAGGLLERLWFPGPALLAEEAAPAAPEALAEDVAIPWKNSVPRIDDLSRLAREDPEALSDARLEELADAWIAPSGRIAPRRGVVAARIPGRALDRRVPPGSWALFTLRPDAPREGRIVLATHPSIADPDLDGGATVRVWERRRSTRSGTPDEPWSVPDVVLAAACDDPSQAEWVFGEDELEELRIVAELTEVL